MNDQDHIQYRDGVPPHCSASWLPGMRIIDSPNFDERPPGTVIDTVILHYISLPPEHFSGDAVARLFTNSLDASAHPGFAGLEGLRVSSHFFLRRHGGLVQFVPPENGRGMQVYPACWIVSAATTSPSVSNWRAAATARSPTHNTAACSSCWRGCLLPGPSGTLPGTATWHPAARKIPGLILNGRACNPCWTRTGWCAHLGMPPDVSGHVLPGVCRRDGRHQVV